ncbi:hypothetical protein B0G38_000091 [Arthrobacter sp. VKM Ac-2550]|nr:hypothetical protein [Arthrobacter sp. VKM Ac-2550]
MAPASGVIGGAESWIEDLQAEEQTMQAAVTAAASTANSTLVIGALQEVYDGYLSKALANASVRAANACTETGNAVSAYVRGDRDMAENANAAAARMPDGEA